MRTISDITRIREVALSILGLTEMVPTLQLAEKTRAVMKTRRHSTAHTRPF